MSTLSFYKVTSLPGTLQPNSLYWVLNGNYAEMYLTSSTGVSKMIGNTQMIKDVTQPLIDKAIADAAAGASAVTIVADIAARNAITNKRNGMEVLVLDATGDTTVKAGAATYVYQTSNTSWIKINEAESMDVVLQWANIQGKPTSSAAQIDSAVTASHSHTNMATLNKLGENSDGLTFNGQNVSAALQSADW